MKHVAFVAALALAAGLSTQTQPNILLVMTDDQGFGDFSGHGNPVLDTPALDAFAKQCPQVDRFYVCPVCSPTRASLMTGRYHYRTRVVDTWIGRSMMEPSEVTIAEVLRAAGYRTGIFGKWHLGDCHPMRPIDQGFDESIVHRGGGLAQPSEPIENDRRYTNAVLEHNGELVATTGYCTDVYFEHATRFVDECIDADKPFFAYVATNAPHGPCHDVPPALLAKYKARDMTAVCKRTKQHDVVARTFAMIENIDQNFGRLIAHLDQRGVSDNTIVVFLCDNGPVANRAAGEFRGHKASVYDGGIRSPLWIRWPGRYDPETRIRRAVAHIDLMPTLLAASGTTPPEGLALDGRSMAALLANQPADWPDRHLVLQVHRGNEPIGEHHFAVIGKRWKLVRHSGFGNANPKPDVPFELFDLQQDPSERHNVAAENEAVVARLRDIYRQWFQDVSTTRSDNYAPPRIHIGTIHQRETVLTRQDWRPADGLGWGHEGMWLLRNRTARQFEVTLLFREARAVQGITIEAGGRPQVVRRRIEGDRIDCGAVDFSAGAIDFRIVCKDGEQVFAPYQVLLVAK